MKNTAIASWRRLCNGFLLAATVVASTANAQSPLTFSKSFAPDTIGPGGVSTLTFSITNNSAAPVTDLAFSDTLPAGATIATPANAMTTCGAGSTLTTPNGGTTITFADGTVGAGAACSITVDVTSSTVGTHTNTSGDLTSNAGNSGTASADLTVATNRPGFTKSFSPSSISLGGRSTLTFTIDNSANTSPVTNLDFTDNLPVGMVIASPANAATDCGTSPLVPTLTATPGSSVITLMYLGTVAFPAVAAGAICTVSVDIIATGIGLLANTSGELTSTVGQTTVSSGKASATLQVTVDPLSLTKSFTDDPVPPGGTVTLEFTITNFERNFSATNITFTDDLDAVVSGLVAVGLPLSNPCGPGSQLTGTSILTLTGGNLAAGASCTFSATLQVPINAATGAFTNTTSQITGDVDGSLVVGSAASENLFVEPAPLLTKSFTDDPVGAGGTVTLQFTITNTSPTSMATDIAFIDELTTFLPFPVSATLPATPCSGASSISLVSCGTDCQALSLTGGSLAAADSCTFDVLVDMPVGFPAGNYVNTTEQITATVDAATVTGNPASDTLEVVAAPRLTKDFTDDPVAPGDTVNLEFTLTHGPTAAGNATGITFSDDLAAALSGLAATGLPMSDVCGTGSQIDGTTNLMFTGGTLSPGESCIFNVTLQVPGTAPPGAHTNTTSSVVATVLGETATENAAGDDLMISGLTLTKSFTNDPVLPGGTVDLQFTIENISPTETATAIVFFDDLDDTLTGLTATGLPLTDPCSTGSSLTGQSGNTVLSFSGGSLAPGEMCTFSVTLNVPAAAPSDTYPNATSNFQATVGGSTVTFDNATDDLIVSSDLLLLTKSFTNDPVASGGTVSLEFTLSNLDVSNSITGISFTDDLNAALAGLVATGLPLNNICGAGSQISGTGVLSFTGGSLAPGASCTFTVTIAVPSGAPGGTVASNTTSAATGTSGGLPVTGDPATDNLQINFLSLSKAFGSTGQAGGTVTLSFTIQNLNTTGGASDLSFTDNLDAALSGLVVTGGLPPNPCSASSVFTGTSLLTLTGGSLLPGGSCTFSVDLQIPATPLAGSFPNVTSDLREAGIPVAGPASATLVVATQITNRVTVTATGATPAMGETTDPVQP